MESESRIIVIFGAGKIGRSFIGQLFSRSGYEVVFLDIDTQLVHDLNQKKEYNVVIKEQQKDTILRVSNVRAIAVQDKKAVIQEIANSSLMAVSVGKSAFPKILPLIGEGIRERYRLFPDRTIDIIIAENIRSAARIIKPRLRAILGDDFPFEKLVGLVETSIGKMVPLMTPDDLKEDPLQVFAESYNDLILDKYGFKGAVPVVEGICPKDNIKAWVDRKAFIHNMGHATIAYIGAFYHPDAQFIYEVLSDRNIFSFAKKVMQQAARILLDYYPNDFTLKELEFHIDDLLSRFQNKALKDTVFRVGQDLPRKLNITDRFAGIMRMARKRSLAYDLILEAMTFGFFFRKTNEAGELSDQDKQFIQSLSRGVDNVLISLCGFNSREDQNFIDELNKQYIKLNQTKLIK